MTTLRLGAHELPPGEVVLVQTLLRLFQHGGPFRWTFVTAPPYDALLTDGTSGPHQLADANTMARAVLRLTRMHDADAPNTLQRPIRAERLQNWLALVERDLLGTRPAEPAASAPAVAEASADEPAMAADDAAAEGTRFKLRRWPPAIALRGDANRIRMATMLSRRALSITELATLSRQSPSDCQNFMNLLRSAGLVEQRTPVPATSAPAAVPAPSPKFGRSLIAGIRRRLGL
ncbi:MAG: hypothetical protein JSS17_09235 [Proteobacteria bacterium]|nr:hypothetical protein [Pseudomonadota bacterium]